MLTIRLQRVGRKNDPSFRVVVTDSKHGPQSGKFLEVVGAYDAREGKGKATLKADRIKHWISVGASTSDTVQNLLVSKKVVTSAKRPVKIPAKKVEAVAPTPEATPVSPETKEEPVEVPEVPPETPAEEVPKPETETQPEA